MQERNLEEERGCIAMMKHYDSGDLKEKGIIQRCGIVG